MKPLVLALLASVIGSAAPTCKTVGLITVCTEIFNTPIGSTVRISVQDTEEGAYFPVSAFWVEGRIGLENGALTPFKINISRDHWLGPNTSEVDVPAAYGPALSIPLLVVIPRRDDASITFYPTGQ